MRIPINLSIWPHLEQLSSVIYMKRAQDVIQLFSCKVHEVEVETKTMNSSRDGQCTESAVPGIIF
jgi:hypothetical protein